LTATSANATPFVNGSSEMAVTGARQTLQRLGARIHFVRLEAKTLIFVAWPRKPSGVSRNET
jgi:hypothetical protein